MINKSIVSRFKIYTLVGFTILLLSGACTGVVTIGFASTDELYIIFLALAFGIFGICSGLIVLAIARHLRHKPPHWFASIAFVIAATPLYFFSYESIAMLLGRFNGDTYSLAYLVAWDSYIFEVFMGIVIPISLFLISAFCLMAAIDNAVLCILYKRNKTKDSDRTFD